MGREKGEGEDWRDLGGVGSLLTTFMQHSIFFTVLLQTCYLSSDIELL